MSYNFQYNQVWIWDSKLDLLLNAVNQSLWCLHTHNVVCFLNLSVSGSGEKCKYLTISQQWETVWKGQLYDEIILHWDEDDNINNILKSHIKTKCYQKSD